MATLFRENGIDYERVDYFTEPLTVERLRSLLKKSGLRAFEVLRTKETKFKELGITPETPENEIVRLIVENPSLLQRPIVEVGDRAILARPAEKALELIK